MTLLLQVLRHYCMLQHIREKADVFAVISEPKLNSTQVNRTDPKAGTISISNLSNEMIFLLYRIAYEEKRCK